MRKKQEKSEKSRNRNYAGNHKVLGFRNVFEGSRPITC